MLPGRKSGFRAGFRPDSSRESIKIGPPGGLRPAGGTILRLSRLESSRNPARKPDFRPGSTIAKHMGKPGSRVYSGFGYPWDPGMPKSWVDRGPGWGRVPLIPNYTSSLMDVFACYTMLRNSASGPEIGLPGRISAGF